jgi:hypothetical protein
MSFLFNDPVRVLPARANIFATYAMSLIPSKMNETLFEIQGHYADSSTRTDMSLMSLYFEASVFRCQPIDNGPRGRFVYDPLADEWA